MPDTNDTLTVDKLYDSIRKIKPIPNSQSQYYPCNPCAPDIMPDSKSNPAPILKPRGLGLSMFCGMPIIENPQLVIAETKQRKIHKNKLINWIFAKAYGFETITKPDSNLYQAQGKLIGHPETIKTIWQRIQEEIHVDN
jgi:hypothetical protein